MRLSAHEQQILDEIQRGLQADDPAFFASMDGGEVHRRRTILGPALFVLGLVAFCLGAILTLALPGVGIGLSLAGFLVMFWGALLFFSGSRAFRRKEAWRSGRFTELGARMGDPPLTGGFL